MLFKLIIVLTVCCVLSLGSYDAIEAQFNQFVTKYGKVYESDEEYTNRRIIFQSNIFNAKYLQANEQGTATYGITKFSDLTRQEFSDQYLMAPEQLATFKKGSPVQFAENEVGATDDGFDWRTKGAVRPVGDQGALSSSLVYAYQANIDTQYFLKFGKLPEYAANDLCFCPFQLQCRGTAQPDANSCIVADQKFTWTGVTSLSKNEDDLASWLPKNAPFVSVLNANTLQYYTGGIFHPKVADCDPLATNTAMAVVGYGTDSSTGERGAGTPYWILRNSWGKDWGEAGYARVFKGGDVCGMADYCTSAQLVAN